MFDNVKHWLFVAGIVVFLGLTGWAIYEFYLMPSSGLPEPNRVVKVTSEERSQSQELIKKAHQIKPPSNGRFNPDEGRKRLELLSKALEKNPLNTELRRRLMQEYADGWGWYEGTISDTESRERIRELTKEGLSLQIPWRERKKLVNEMIATTENMFGLGNYEARWQVAQENQYSDYWLKILLKRALYEVRQGDNAFKLLRNSEEKLEKYHEETGKPIFPSKLYLKFLKATEHKQRKNYEKAYKLTKEVVKEEDDLEGEVPIGWFESPQNTLYELMCLTGRIEERKKQIYQSYKDRVGPDVEKWPKVLRDAYKTACDQYVQEGNDSS